MLVDTHCHIHEADFPIPLKELLANAKEKQVDTMVTIGTNEQSAALAIQVAQNNPNIYAAVGVYPHEKNNNLEFLKKIDYTDPKLVAIGEIGLDYFHQYTDKKTQAELLRKQLLIAKKYQLPVVFHVRDAFDDFWRIFDEVGPVRGVVHSFSDSLENLNQALSRDLFIGVNGIVTFSKNKTQLEAFAKVPLNKMLLETDAPFLAPAGHRGKVNQPAYIKDIAIFLSDFYKIDFAELAKQTTLNAKELFGIK